MKATINGVQQEVTSTLVHKGSSVDVQNSDVLLTAFNATDTDQYIEISTDSGNERLDYDPATNTMEFEGATYAIGD